ncbi:hypothetical protein [Sphingobacterium bovistauri]|uniref:Outer membrane protein beta-barrel domain-containing protein n=1 Tax=Sphingobacterium bovistauri TaxID=2781959 RepID=A0ABS7Z356_9SPHI|nr:hypothetical protein [Sphingobacterium bovistauri]MCA5004582.1 hypothetical protein [Sphingobacterium bovistauri]
MIKYVSILLFSILFSVKILVAQSFVSFPFSGYDEDATINIGFQYNFINQNYQLKLKDKWNQLFEDMDTDMTDITYLGDLKAIYSKSSNGFSIGIPVDFKLNDRVFINVNPSFNILNSHQISYVPMDSELNALDRKSKHMLGDTRGDNFNSFEFPFGLKFKSEEKRLFNSESKFRAYFVGGFRLTRWSGLITNYRNLEIEQNNNRPIPEGLILKPEYMSWDVGAGFDFYLTHFKVSPEVRFNQSLSNVFSTHHVLSLSNKFMAPIDRGVIRNIYFSLIFQ